jgi:hypothetical protein
MHLAIKITAGHFETVFAAGIYGISIIILFAAIGI